MKTVLIVGLLLLPACQSASFSDCRKIKDYSPDGAHYGVITQEKLQAAIDQSHACKNGWPECRPNELGCRTVELIDILSQKWNCEQ
jgi:hypothetical protein